MRFRIICCSSEHGRRGQAVYLRFFIFSKRSSFIALWQVREAENKISEGFSGIINNQYIYFATLIAITLLVIGIIPGLSLLYYEEWRLNAGLLLQFI